MFGSNSGWLFTDAAESLFVVSIAITVLIVHCGFQFFLCHNYWDVTN